MMHRLRLRRLLILSGALAFGMGAVSARADTSIVNTAHAQWGAANGRASVDSNAVILPLTQDPGATLTVLHPDAGSSAKTDYRASICRTAGQATPLGTPGSAGSTSIGLSPASAIHPGETFYFKLAAPFANRDAAAIDTLTAVVTTKSGDRETLTIYETGIDTGIFMGSLVTQATPPKPVVGDCRLSLADGDQIMVEAQGAIGATPIATATVDVLIDPYGLLFDSEDGSPVSGVNVTLIDATTGLPAKVFAPDGTTRWPSTVVSGQTVTDSAGNLYPLPDGEYRFPLTPPGNYRLRITTTEPYTAPSKITAAQLGDLTRPDGGVLTIVDASYGGSFALINEAPVRIDVPLDRPAVAVGVTKTASRSTASPGDAILYTITARNTDPLHAKRGVSVVDALPAALRLRKDSVRVDGVSDPTAVNLGSDGRQITISIGQMAPLQTHVITYALEVKPDAPEGQAVNTARSSDSRGASSLASVSVRITKETIAARMTLIGRIIEASCQTQLPFTIGVPGIRVMLEDGSYAVTDRDGRYHFEGLIPGTHVAQIDAASVAGAWTFVDCARSTRAAGSATSRFVEGQGGTLAVADFHAVRGPVAASVKTAPKLVSDREAAGAERNWFAGGTASIAWLYPDIDTNPRAPVVRVAIRHLPGQAVQLSANVPVDAISLDGTRDDASKAFSVTLWRGIPLAGDTTTLKAVVTDANGRTVSTLERVVHYSGTPARAEFLADHSNLVADGIHRPGHRGTHA